MIVYSQRIGGEELGVFVTSIFHKDRNNQQVPVFNIVHKRIFNLPPKSTSSKKCLVARATFEELFFFGFFVNNNKMIFCSHETSNM